MMYIDNLCHKELNICSYCQITKAIQINVFYIGTKNKTNYLKAK